MKELECFPLPVLQYYWYPVLPSSQLKKTPQAVQLMGYPLVFVRLSGKSCCFFDRCPHRLVPLSLGQIVNDRLQCCYHGWQFDAGGQLQHTPGSCAPVCHIRLRQFPVIEQEGFIWVNLQRKATERRTLINFPLLPDHVFKQIYRTINCGLFHVAENFLDPCHTPYVHKSLLRSQEKQHLSVKQQILDNGLITYYSLFKKQNGWINRLFDPGVDCNIARFTLPGMIELEYTKQQKLLFKVLLYLLPIDAGKTGIIARIYIPKSMIPAVFRFALLTPFVSALFNQDKSILEQQQHAQERYGEKAIFAKTDLVASPLRALLHGKEAKVVNVSELFL